MRFDIAVVNHNTDFYLHNLLASIDRTIPTKSLELVHVWDNASSDRSRKVLEQFGSRVGWLRVHPCDFNAHHGPALDALLREHCESEWVLLLDSDTEIRRDFTASLPPLAPHPPAFVGQIHPLMPHLYAYLAHLLVHRPTYTALPPFRRHGAPGIDYFQEIEHRGLSWTRFRWMDFVEHFGQGTLREIYRRRETSNELYGFAANQFRSTPVAGERRQREERLYQELHDFLSESRASGTQPPPMSRVNVPTLLPVRRRTSGLGAWAVGLQTRRFRHACRLGLGPDADSMRLLFRLVRRLAPSRVLEVGASYPGSLYLWTRAAAPKARLVRLGRPLWELDDPWEAFRVAELKAFAQAGQHVEVLRQDPLAPGTSDEIERLLEGFLPDFLFWNDHSADLATESALLAWARRVRPGGIVALALPTGSREHATAWTILSGEYPSAEISEAGSGRTIGVVFVCGIPVAAGRTSSQIQEPVAAPLLAPARLRARAVARGTAVVVAVWSGSNPRDLERLCASLNRYRSGGQYDLVLAVNGQDYALPDDCAPFFAEVLVRENVGWNLGAWDQAWRTLLGYDRFLFLQDACTAVGDDWLAAFRHRFDSKSDCGLVGEHLCQAWDRPWKELSDPDCPRPREIDPIRRAAYARYFRKKLASWGVPEGAHARFVSAVVHYTTRGILEEVDGYELGRSHDDAVAAEIAFSRKLEARGYCLLQLTRRRHSRIAHPQWSRAS